MTIIDDDVLEDEETLFLTLNNGLGAEYDTGSYGDVVIIDDDDVMVKFDAESCELSVAESAGYVELEITRVGLSSIPVEVMVLIQNGTATGLSYTSLLLCTCTIFLPRAGRFHHGNGRCLFQHIVVCL